MTTWAGNNKVPLVVTTAHRGVLFGYGEYILRPDKTIELEQVRMCLYWPAENRGVVGLASEGPLQGARVGPATPSMLISDVTAIMRCTASAAKRWEKAPWT